MKVVAFLPAKGSSERIPSKNTKLLNGKPLFLHTLEKLCECDFIDEVYLDSESDEILHYADYLRYTPLKRDASLASNQTDGHQMFYNEVMQVEADIYIQILGTSPFIEKGTIKRGIDILAKDDAYDSVVLVRRDKQYTWTEENFPAYDMHHIPNSKDLPDTILETMGLYMVKHDTAHQMKRRYGDKVYMLKASPTEAIDVNYPEDFALAETIAIGIRQKEVSLFRVLCRHLSTPILSDILFDMGISSVITGLKPNLPDRRIMGRASTLHLRELHEGEDFTGIYDALKAYDCIKSGDVIAVENECPDDAYFGELNANLSIRAGASAAVIGGGDKRFECCKISEFPGFCKRICV